MVESAHDFANKKIKAQPFVCETTHHEQVYGRVCLFDNVKYVLVCNLLAAHLF